MMMDMLEIMQKPLSMPNSARQNLQNWGLWTQMAPSAPFSARAQARRVCLFDVGKCGNRLELEAAQDRIL